MKNSKSFTWVRPILAAALAAGGITFSNASFAATSVPEGRAALRGRLLERAKEQLGLSDDQVAQIKSILQADKDTLVDLLSRLHAARAGLRAAIQGDAGEAGVRAASAKVAAVEADLAVARMKLHGKISPILTAEQREKLKELRARVDDFVDRALGRFSERLAE